MIDNTCVIVKLHLAWQVVCIIETAAIWIYAVKVPHIHESLSSCVNEHKISSLEFMDILTFTSMMKSSRAASRMVTSWSHGHRLRISVPTCTKIRVKKMNRSTCTEPGTPSLQQFHGILTGFSTASSVSATGRLSLPGDT